MGFLNKISEIIPWGKGELEIILCQNVRNLNISAEIGQVLERIAAIQKRDVSGEYYDCAADVKLGDPGQFNWILLLSVQGSGNTWTRQLLQSMTGYYAGGVYREIDEEFDTDELFEKSPFPGEHFAPESGRVLGVKSHARGHIRKGSAIVLIMRNPYDTLKANFNRIVSEKESGDGHGAHTGTISAELFLSSSWRNYIKNHGQVWSEYYQEAVRLSEKNGENFHFLWYDLLKTDKIGQMRKLYSFLQEEASDNFEVENFEERLECIENQNLDRYKRKKQEIDFDLFLPDEIMMINKFIEEYKEFFKKNNIDFPEETIDSCSTTIQTVTAKTCDPFVLMCSTRHISVNFDQNCWTHIPIDTLYLTWQKSANLSSSCQFTDSGQAAGACGKPELTTGSKDDSDVIKDYNIELVTRTDSTPVFTGDMITVDMKYTAISSSTGFRFSSCEASIGPVTIPLLENGCPNAWSIKNIGLVQYKKLHEISFIAFFLEGYSNLSVTCSVIMVDATDANVLSYLDTCTNNTRSVETVSDVYQRKFTIQSNLELENSMNSSRQSLIFAVFPAIIFINFL
ncbi:Oidioi.mRNA.OKI2018_I69.chr2.g7680.t1.cds [Oikopleura dioica]|uniref:Sulfotransferase n=1 Tax=Oikopleura dioica TaxID=34765 RepID=A0ABN7TBQ7_OIKDI|nr:Oidioi.mRNA.OKI2018_I69.chr2.g7680.t1.cds [Oikopleura dioica]